MTTTIGVVANTGPDDEGYQPRFPASTGIGMAAQLKESKSGASIPKPKVQAKKFIKAAEGKVLGKKPKVKKGKKPENLRASEAKNQKRGAFGEKYTAPSGSKGKGVRVAESNRSSFETRLGRFL